MSTEVLDTPRVARVASRESLGRIRQWVPEHLLPGGSAQFSPWPVRVTAGYLERMRRLAVLLDQAFRGVVARYFLDARIRDIYGLSAELEDTLRRAESLPYRLGFYRPDLVFDRRGQARICEAGARYPLNGWILSLLSQRALAAPAGSAPRPLPADDARFWEMIRRLLPPGSTVAMVHAHEPGTEIFCLREELHAQGSRFLSCAPDQLSVHQGRIVVRIGEQATIVDRLILVMDRSELGSIPRDVLREMIASGCYFNDVRTLILIHDKRVLAVLFDEDIMRDCMPANDYVELRPYLIPSWVANHAATREALAASPLPLIAKRNSGGRGIGVKVRHECSDTEWREFVYERWQDYMFQEYLSQQPQMEPETGRPMHLVGMVLCHGATCFGAGLFRGSDEAVINLHQGRGRLFPAMLDP